MPRLNNRAYRVLRTEVRKCTENDPLSQVEQKLTLEDLEKLRSQPGSPATSEELRKLVITTYPKFSEKALSAAAKANSSLSVWGHIRLAILALIGVSVVLVGTGGAVGLAIILLASESSESTTSNAPDSTDFASMSDDEHLQQATVLVEEVEQLVNKVTTPASLVLCENKLNEAKKHLDELPVSDTVYSYTKTSSRRSKQRSKRRYSYSQQTIYYDKFASIRSKHEQMQTQVNELKAETARTSSLIKGAQEFAFAAAKSGQNPPHSAARWQEIESLWQKAIDQLEEVPAGNSDYVAAQKLLATYQTNLGTVQTRRQVEQESVEALEQANSQIEDLVASIPADAAAMDRNSTISQIQEIIKQLKKVQKGTTAYPKAQELLHSAQNKLNQL